MTRQGAMTQHGGLMRQGGPVRGASKRLSRMAAAALAVTVAVAAAACGGGASRVEVLGSIGQEIADAYQAFSTSASELDASLARLCADPAAVNEADLGEAVAALTAARLAWAYTGAMSTGPVNEHRSGAVVDWFPEADEIAELLTDETKDLTTERIGTRVGADQRGLGAAEVLLDWHSRAAGGPRIGPATGVGTPVPASDPVRRCDYLRSVAAVVLDEAELIHRNWTVAFEGGAPYTETLSADVEMGVDDLVNGSMFLLEAVNDLELGRALGETSAVADVEALVEGPLGLGASDMLAHLHGVRAVMFGAGAPDNSAEAVARGLSPLLSDDLAGRVAIQIAVAEAAVLAIEGPLRAAVLYDPASVSAARAALKKVQVTISTEVVSQLGVTIGFSDADGDTLA